MADMQKTREPQKTNGYYLPVKVIEALTKRAKKNDRSDSAELARILKRILFKSAA